MPTQKKVETVTELTEKVKKAKSIVFAEYTGIKHKQLEELRRSLKKVNAEFVVTKNRLIMRALGDNGEKAKEILNGDTATVLSYNDEVSGVKELNKFFKAMNLGKTKGGMLGSTVMTDKEVTYLSQLPSREVLLGKLAGQLNAPVTGLHRALSWNINKLVWVLNGVKEKKG